VNDSAVQMNISSANNGYLVLQRTLTFLVQESGCKKTPLARAAR